MITHDPERSRFTADTTHGEASLEYMRDGKRIIFTHTGVPAAVEGRGIGTSLAKAGLDYARDEGLIVKPMCPFVDAFVKRHPEYHPLLAAR